jgi:hypothetical protein
MIEVPGTKVLRFTEEEVRTIVNYYRDDDQEGVDWLSTFIIRTYPEMVLETVVTDWKSNCVYAILTEKHYDVVAEYVIDSEGNRYIDRWVEEY